MFRLVRRSYLKHLEGHLIDYSEGNIQTELTHENYPVSVRGITAGIEALRRMVRMFYIDTGVSTGKVRGAVQEMNHALKSAGENVSQTVKYSDLAHSIVEDVVGASITAEKGVKEINNSAEIVVSATEDIYNESSDVKTHAEAAYKAMEDAAHAFKKLTEASEAMAGKVRVLTENTRDIDSLLSVIQEIASQTDMLALNAAIEAARAGESGRGFSIVADEIQKLSGEASMAADSANRLLAQVNRGITETAAFVKNGEAFLKSGYESVFSGRDRIKELLGKSISIEEKTGSARKAAYEQRKSIARIAEFSEKTAETCRSAADYTETVMSFMSEQRILFYEISEMGKSLDEIADDLVSATGTINIIGSEGDKYDLAGKRVKQLSFDLKEAASLLAADNISTKNHSEVLTNILEKNSDLEAAWTNSSDGRFIVSIPPAGIANAGRRDWYLQAMKGEFFVSDVYISAISKNPCITISLPLSGREGITGVLGVDLKLA